MKDIILLHGAIGSSRQLQPLADSLKERYNVHLLDLPGHGGMPFPGNGFTMKGFADAVLQYADKNKIGKLSFFGYSMGGYVAMLFARQYPQRVEKLITLATKFYWDEAVAAKEVAMLQPDIIEAKIPAFAKELENRHAPLNWKEQLSHTRDLLLNLGKKNVLTAADHKNIHTPSLLMLGDRDKMVTLAETLDVYTALPKGAMAILPQTAHPIEKIDLQLLRFHIEQFLL